MEQTTNSAPYTLLGLPFVGPLGLCRAQETIVLEDSNRLALRVGELIRIPNSEKFPRYAREQTAIIVARYKTLNGPYSNYGHTVMFLSGKKAGEIRRFNSKICSNYKI